MGLAARGRHVQLQVTPITRVQLIVGKILPFVLIGYVQLTVLVVLMALLFDVHIQGSVPGLYAVTGIYIAAVLSLGMWLSTIAQTQTQSMQLTMVISLPFVFLSGYIFPIEGMPTIFQWMTTVVPANCAIQIIRGIVLRGATLAQLAEPIAWLSLYTVLLIGMAVVRFKKTAA